MMSKFPSCAALLALALLATGCGSAPVRGDDPSADPRFGRARRELAAGKPATAIDSFLELVPAYGNSPELLRWLGRARILAGKGRAGRANLRQALAKRPGDLQARTWLADSAFETGLQRDAVDAYELIRAAQPENEHALRRLVDLRLQLGEEHKALAILQERLLPAHPGDPALLRQALRAAMEIDDFESAEKHARTYLGRHDKDPEILEALALALVHKKPREAPVEVLRQAAIQLQECVRLDPNDGVFRYNLALVLEALARRTDSNADYVAAELSYRRAIEIDPRFLDAIENLADLYLQRGNPQKAYPLLEEALRIEEELERSSGVGARKARFELLRKKYEKLRVEFGRSDR